MDSNGNNLNDFRNDGWGNVLTGMGGARDKVQRNRPKNTPILMREELEALYIDDGLAAKIVDAVPNDMTREWIDFDAEIEDEAAEESQKEMFETALDEIGARSAINEALKWARLYGGSVIVIHATGGGALDTPLSLKGLTQINQLIVLPRHCVDLSASEFVDDVNSVDFGKARALQITFPVGVSERRAKVDISRCLLFYGTPLPKAMYTNIPSDDRFWGLSSLQGVFGALQEYAGSTRAVANIIEEFVLGKYTISNLANLLSAGKEKQVLTRIEIINAAKSVLNAVLLDKDEKYERDAASVAAISDLIEKQMAKIAAITGYPQTKLFGQSPNGLSATGESDTTNYYDMVRSQQELIARPAIQRLLDILGASAKLPKGGKWRFKFKPLYQQSKKKMRKPNDLKKRRSASGQKNTRYTWTLTY